jgi:MOSC domain-containing protein YiiM
MIVCRPAPGERQVIETAQLDPVIGLDGDSWTRRHPRNPLASPNPDKQITLMNARAVNLIAGDRSRWPLAGDQLFVDFDLSGTNLPAGTRLVIGTAVLEVTAVPHTGCAKFVRRFGLDAMTFVNGPIGRELNLRGIHARVVERGTIRVGDAVVRR